MSPDKSYRFAQFTLVPGQRLLFRDTIEVSLRPKAFYTLVCLVERGGRVVTKDELLSVVWPDVNVSEEVLTHCIAEVRQALSDDPRHPRFVKTISRHGYKFVAETCRVDEEVRSAQPAVATANEAQAPAAPATAIVVLPFSNISGDPANDFLCDGISEELINALTKLGRLQVVAHSSSFLFRGRDVDAREIGRQLHVGRILEGSVRRTGNRLRVSAQLIDAGSGYHLWCEQYDRKLEDIFAIQEEIARCILESLEIGLLADGRGPLVAPPTSKLDAYLLYLEGRAFWHRRFGGCLERAIERFGQAIARDPGFAMPYAGLADSLSTLGIWAFVPARDVFPKAVALANTALALDPRLAEAHASRALVRMFWDWEWEEAGQGFVRALELNRGHALIRLWYGHYLCVVGRVDEALVEVQRAQVLDPVSPLCSANVGFTFHLAHQQSRAIDELRHVIARDPDSGIAWFYLGYGLIETGRCDEAVCAMERAEALTRGMPFALEGAGLAHARAGRRDEARAILARTRSKAATSFVPPSAIAMLTVGLEEDDAALDALERAVDERDVMLPWLDVMPCFDRLHGHPRFERVLDRLGLPGRGHLASDHLGDARQRAAVPGGAKAT